MAKNRVRLLGVVLLLTLSGCAELPKTQILQIQESRDTFMLTVPDSRLILTVPRRGFVQRNVRAGGATNSPRYFRFENSTESAHLSISGWFEDAERFPGVKSQWEEHVAMFEEAGIPEPLNVTFRRVGNWEAVVWDSQATAISANSHVRAHWVQAGTWIDIHLSVTGYYSSAECRRVLETLLRTLAVKERS